MRTPLSDYYKNVVVNEGDRWKEVVFEEGYHDTNVSNLPTVASAEMCYISKIADFSLSSAGTSCGADFEDPNPSNEVVVLRKQVSGEYALSSVSIRNINVFRVLVQFGFAKCSEFERKRIVVALGGDLSTIYTPAHILCVVPEKSAIDITALAGSLLNLPPHQAAIVAGKLIGMSLKYPFETFPASQAAAQAHRRTQTVYECYPEQLNLPEGAFVLTEIVRILDFCDQPEQAICRYSAGVKENIFLVAGKVHHEKCTPCLKIGMVAVTAQLLSRSEIAKRSAAHIILCQETGTAMHMLRLTSESKAFLQMNIIVSGYFNHANAVDALNLDVILGHPITIVPACSRDGHRDVHKLADRLLKARAMEVSIYPWPLQAEGVFLNEPLEGDHSKWAQEMREKRIDLSLVESISSFSGMITKKAIPYERYRDEWLIATGLIVPAVTETSTTNNASKYTVMSYCEMKNTPQLDFEQPPSLECMIQPGYITFIWGGTDRGKSLVITELAIATATGTGAFCLSGSGCGRKVLVIDGELTQGQLVSRIKQLANLNLKLDFLDENLKYLMNREHDTRLNLLDEKAQNFILNTITKDCIEVLFVDNLISTAGNATQGGDIKLFEFLYKLEHIGVAIVLIDHANKNNEFMGSANLTSKSQTVIKVEGRKELAVLKTPSTALKQAFNDDGALIRLTYEKCKIPPSLNGKHEIYHLPISGVWKYIEGNVKPKDLTRMESLPEDLNGEDMHEEMEPLRDDQLAALSLDQRTLYELFQPGVTYTRKEIEELLQWREDKAGNELKALKDARLVEKVGSGRSTKYKKV